MKKLLILSLIGAILVPQAAFAQYSTDSKANALIVSLMARIESLEKELAQFKKDDSTQLKKLSPKEKKKLEREEKRKKAKLEREAKKRKIEANKKENDRKQKRDRYIAVIAEIERITRELNQYEPKDFGGENKLSLEKEKYLVEYPNKLAELTLEKRELEKFLKLD